MGLKRSISNDYLRYKEILNNKLVWNLLINFELENNIGKKYKKSEYNSLNN